MAKYGDLNYNVVKIDKRAFFDHHIGILTVPPSIQGGEIGDFFYGETKIDSLIVEDSDVPIKYLAVRRGVRSAYVGRNAVWGEGLSGGVTFIQSKIENVIFGENVWCITNDCFQSCKNLKNVAIPCVTYINYDSFSACSALKQISGPRVTHIMRSSFNTCISLEDFNFPCLEVLGDEAFRNCKSLKNVVLPSSVITLGYEAFGYCANLESVILPENIIEYGDRIFVGCKNLMNVTSKSPNPIAISENTFDAKTYEEATLHVPVGSLNNYKSSKGWKNFVNIVEDSSINNDSESVHDMQTSSSIVIGLDGAIRVSGYVDGEIMAIYDNNGQLIVEKVLNGLETTIPVTSGQVYVVRLNSKTVKIAI